MSKERDTLLWLDGVLDTIMDANNLKGPTPSGKEDNYISIPRDTFNRLRERIGRDLETKNDNQTLLRG